MSHFDFLQSPMDNFISMYKEAVESKVPEAHAMVLSTVGADSKPSSRVVYYKQLTRGEITFFTNYHGQKSIEIQKNPNVSLNFFWPALYQQIRIEGKAEKTTFEESQKYFQTRPRLSQLGAWASDQSQVIADYKILEKRIEELEKKYQGQEVPCPPHWGGFRIAAEKFEFWFGKNGRLHERYVYVKKPDGSWNKNLLNP